MSWQQRSREDALPDDERPATVSFTVPAWVLAQQGMDSDTFGCWVRLAAAIFRYRRSEITLGTAAALAGVSQSAFMQALKDAEIDTFVVDWEDLDRELAHLAELRPGAVDG